MKAYQNLNITGSINVTGNGITGSLAGTASFSTSASYATSASYTISASYATSASLATSSSISVTSSYSDGFRISGSLTATGSEASTFISASFVHITPITQDVLVINNKVQLGNAQRPSENANYSVAMGNNTSVSGAYALGIGAQNFIANGANATFVAGQYNTASALFQTVVGQYNAADNTAGAFIVGGGTGTEASTRKNTAVFTTASITLSGSVDISGSLLLNGVVVGKGGASVTITGSAPSGSKDSGSLWWNENDGNLYVQVTSPTGSTYVPATNTVAGGNYGATLVSAQTGSTWNINHNLNTITPLITVYSGSSVMIPAGILSIDANNTRITFSGSVTGTAVLSTGIGNATAELATSASIATSASFASTASALNTLNQAVVVSGSFTVHTGSATEFQVTNTGVKIGNIITDRHTITGSLTISGSIVVTGSITASLLGTASFADSASYVFPPSGSAKILTSVTGSWTVPTGTSQQSFTVADNNTYVMWVRASIPNGIIAWNATVTVTNTNVPVLGTQDAWVYTGGGTPIDIVNIPAQITSSGTNTILKNSGPLPGGTISTNVFRFTFNNTSGGTVPVFYGYTQL